MRILAMAPNPWHGPWMNRQQLLSRVAERHSIVYSTGLLSHWDRGTDAWKEAPLLARFTTSDGVILHKPGRWPLRIRTGDFVDRLSTKLGARPLRKVVGQTGQGPFTLYIFHPSFAPYVAAMRPDKVVYHAYDFYAKTPGWSAALQQAEDKLLLSADLCIASSKQTAESLTNRVNGKANVRFLPNGADSQAFIDASANKRIPADMASIPGPRIGYVGNLNRKVDLALIAWLASQRPGWQLIVVGGVGSLDSHGIESLQECQALANVHLLGHKAVDQLPDYVAALDIGLMAYRVTSDTWTSHIFPLKLHEYLAAGLPVVSARLPALEEFNHVITLASEPAEWLAAIDYHLQANDEMARRQRQAFAVCNDWSERAFTLCHWLDEL